MKNKVLLIVILVYCSSLYAQGPPPPPPPPGLSIGGDLLMGLFVALSYGVSKLRNK